MDGLPTLTLEQASSYARLALANVEREYPSKLDHVITSAITGSRLLRWSR